MQVFFVDFFKAVPHRGENGYTGMQEFLTALVQRHDLPDEARCALLETDAMDGALFQAADRIRRERYGTEVFVRGLIEFTNYCRNDCYYCGIRRSNG